MRVLQGASAGHCDGGIPQGRKVEHVLYVLIPEPSEVREHAERADVTHSCALLTDRPPNASAARGQRLEDHRITQTESLVNVDEQVPFRPAAVIHDATESCNEVGHLPVEGLPHAVLEHQAEGAKLGRELSEKANEGVQALPVGLVTVGSVGVTNVYPQLPLSESDIPEALLDPFPTDGTDQV